MRMDANTVYKQYLRGREYLQRYDYYTRAEESYRFYNGDQWDGLKFAGEKPPALNILAPIVDYKVATVAQNGMSINYSTLNFGELYKMTMQVCERLNSYAKKTWERLKLDHLVWKVILDGAVLGDAFLYFFEKDGLVEVKGVDATSIYFADEQESNLQEQKYIIIAQRLFVSDVRDAARANKVDESDIALIMPDNETDYEIGDKAKEEIAQDEDGKCLCFLKMFKEDGIVHFLRSTKNVIYQEDTMIEGLTRYPIAHFKWNSEKGSARGIGEVYYRIPNQIEINKTLARNLASIKQTAYPHIVYNKEKLTPNEVSRLSTVGSTIGAGDKTTENIRNVIGYMEPAQINPIAINIVQELMSSTRELAGAGEAVTGNINPEQASGAAIIAVRDASALPLTFQKASFKQFVEDIALVWFDIWVAYNPNGLEIISENKNIKTGSSIPVAEFIPSDVLQELKIEVRIDVSPSNPYSKFAQEQTLQNLLQMQLITFEEYVAALDDDSVAPKAKLKEILQKQQLKAQAQQQAKDIIRQQQAQAQTAQQSESDKAKTLIREMMADNMQMKTNGQELADDANEEEIPAEKI